MRDNEHLPRKTEFHNRAIVLSAVLFALIILGMLLFAALAIIEQGTEDSVEVEAV